MMIDQPPEAIQCDASALSLDEAVKLPDVGAQPGPEDLDLQALEPTAAALAADLDRVQWPADDENAPDYAYLAAESAADELELSPDALELLIKRNRYSPYRDEGVIAFGLRGAQLPAGHEVEGADRIRLLNVRPDHRHFRCIIGFYFTDTKQLSAFTASTVPCRRAVWGYVNGGDRSNMLPTGLHTFYVWRHKAIRPALRMGESSANPEPGAEATVLRNTNDYVMGTRDLFDPSVPYDNVHCSYYLSENTRLGAYFSSWGCLTVRGRNPATDQWKKFQGVLDSLGEKTRVDLLLATGKDVALAAAALRAGETGEVLTALRRGSRGDEVKRLQQQIGVSPTGFYGAHTLDKFTGAQRGFNEARGRGAVADGVYTPALDQETGWGVFSG